MSGKSYKFQKNKLVAKPVTDNRQPCVFCQKDADDEVVFGKLYSLGDIQCHYFCVLLSCCLVQKGKDTEGLFGFLYKDIMAEVERSKKHKCSYCGQSGANLGCAVSQCRKQFHLPCGRQKNVVSLFYGNYKSFCEMHAPKQKISDEVMAKVKERRKKERLNKANKGLEISTIVEETKQTTEPEESATVCVICYEEVAGFPSSQTFWPPCCGRDAWLHRSCLQRMALSAGMHYIKCPLCNDREQFYDAVCEQGYYLPDRDAAWELEQNAFAEIYERPATCGAGDCKCPFGRAHDEPGLWDIQLCLLCGSTGSHAHCAGAARLVCGACRPLAGVPELEARLMEMIAAEQEREARNVRGGPVMPSRMSLRRTKGRMAAQSAASSSQSLPRTTPSSEKKTENESPPKSAPITRQELNLKTPKRAKFLEPSILQDLDNTLLSPLKMLEQRYMEKLEGMEETAINCMEVIEKVRAKLNKPKPLSEKKKIVNEIIEDLFKNALDDGLKRKDFAKDYSSPKKCVAITEAHENLNNKPAKDEERNKTANHQNSLETIDNSINEKFTTNEDTTKKDGQLDISEEDKENVENIKSTDVDTNSVDNDTEHDDSSNSTFELPPEFIADDDSIFETPKKLTNVKIEHNSSLEISENNECVNIDVIEIEDESKSPTTNSKKENSTNILKPNEDIDVETFKDQYLKFFKYGLTSSHRSPGSFCEMHAPKQKISDEVMAKVKERRKKERLNKANKGLEISTIVEETKQTTEPEESATVCVICYEEVAGFPSSQTFWPPCCGRDAWLHRSCLQRMALSAGMHYIKCPLCNDREQFYDAVCEQGYYLPDRDAAWELEQNAFAEIYERPATCGAGDCKCPFGRAHDEPGLWDIQLCLLCGSTGSHAHCAGAARLVCGACRPLAGVPELEARLMEMIAAEQEREARNVRGGPVMPSRMSLRRTKGRMAAQSAASSSQSLPRTTPSSEKKTENESPPKSAPITRQELNLKTPKRAKFLEPSILQDLDNTLLSPLKMLEQRYMEKLEGMEETAINCMEVIEKVRAKLNKPKPLSEKKKIVNEIIEDLFKNALDDGLKRKDFAKDYSSPKKCVAITEAHENLNNKPAKDEERNKTANHQNSLETIDNSINEKFTTNEDTTKKDGQLDISEEDKENVENIKSTDVDTNSVDNDTEHDDSSNSTFELPPEFIADDDSIFETPKKLTNVKIEHNSSLEISENNECVNIDVIEIEDESKSPTTNSKKENSTNILKPNEDIDVETFKDQYLKEVEIFKCNFNHKHLDNRDMGKLRTVIDFAVEVNRKRKLESDKKGGKRRKRDAEDAQRKITDKERKYDDQDKERKRRKKLKRKEKIEKRKLKEKNHLKIKFKEEQKLKKRVKKMKVKDKMFKQYVLKFSPVKSKVKKVIGKPENDFTPLKRKYVKNVKSPDSLVQTSIQSYFNVK